MAHHVAEYAALAQVPPISGETYRCIKKGAPYLSPTHIYQGDLHILSMDMHVSCMSDGRSNFPPGTVCTTGTFVVLVVCSMRTESH